MIPLRVSGVRVLDARLGVTALVGETSRDRLVGWIGNPDQLPVVGGVFHVLEQDVLAFAASDAPSEALELLAAWPAWRVVEAASLEIGARVLVVGSGTLAERVAALSSELGALVSLSESAGAGSRVPWDVVVFTDGPAEGFARVLSVCRARGRVIVAASLPAPLDVNTYPDLHRRGLEVVALDPYDSTPTTRAEWTQALARLHHLLSARAPAPG